MRTTRTPGVSSLGTILSIWAHPDDETYLAAGLMAAARDHGQRVVCVSATLGERGTPDPEMWPELRLGQVRRWEAAAAMTVLGVDEHHILGLPDGDLAALDSVGFAWAARLIDHLRPDTILTFGPDGITFHPDHIAVHRWVTQAWADGGGRSRLLYAAPSMEHLAEFGELYEQWDMYMSDERPAGVPSDDLAVHVRLAGWQLDRKITALRAMASQTSGLIAMLGADVYAAQVAEESFVDARTHAPRTLAPLASVW
jgi:LmbE family N-acetylglucosaminyl deacetylase